MTKLFARISVLAVAMALLFMAFASRGAVADDSATTQPTTQPSNGSIKATVTDQDDKPVEGASVTVRARRSATTQPSSESGGRRAAVAGRGTTDANGQVTIDGIPPGEYNLRARKSQDGARARATVEAGQTVEVSLQLAPGTGGGRRNRDAATTQPQ